MKLNKILMALSAMAIVGCSSEDFNDPSATQAINDSRLIELNENFVLAGVGEVDNTMRTHWEQDGSSLVNKFLPIFTTAPAGGNLDTYVDATAQSIGLCWVGNGAVGSDVYTNYQFYHFGWLNNDQTAANIECNALTNGAMYDEITVAAGAAIGDEADPADFGLPAKSAAGLNYNSGIYKTENKAIFGGDYIVYYPYNENFKDAGTIPATAETNWAVAPTDFDSPVLGEATFRYSKPVHIDGGKQAADFGLKNLSTLVRLKVAAPAGDALITGTKKFDQVVLFSASKQLLKQANLAADKIAAGKEGAELYASTEGTKTIVANFAAMPFQATTTKPLATPYITVLPTTVDDLVAFVHREDGPWARVDLGRTEFEAGSAKALTITVASTGFTNDFIAVDEASLTTALTDANTAAATATQTINVIGDITLSTPAYKIDAATYPNIANITITGDDIIVPQDVTLTLGTNMESNVRVLGKSCCTGAKGGRLVVEGGKLNNITMVETEAKTKDDTTNPMVTFSGAATIVAGKKFDVQAGKVEVNAAIAHKGNIEIGKDATVIVGGTGDLQFNQPESGTVVNNGTIEVLANGNFDMTDENGDAAPKDGKRMTNNGKFIHNVDAQVGTAVQSMHQEGEYRCKVNTQNKLNDAYLQWTACSVIEIIAAGGYDLVNVKKHNDVDVDIDVNAPGVAIFNNPTDTDKGDNNTIQIGNLTVIAGGLEIAYTGTAAPNNKRTLIVNGDMVVKAATTMTSSQKIEVKKNLTVENAGAADLALTYAGNQANVDGLAVTGDIKVIGDGNHTTKFDAKADNALNITCANFYLEKKATAEFGNRNVAKKNLEVNGTISNPATCTFDIKAAAGGNLLGWVECKQLKSGGSFPNSRPLVVE